MNQTYINVLNNAKNKNTDRINELQMMIIGTNSNIIQLNSSVSQMTNDISRLQSELDLLEADNETLDSIIQEYQ